MDDYYAGRGESPGVWVGRGAAVLALDGVVEEGQLGRLIGGRDPSTAAVLRSHPPKRQITVERIEAATGERWLERKTLAPVAGFDLVFSVPMGLRRPLARPHRDPPLPHRVDARAGDTRAGDRPARRALTLRAGARVPQRRAARARTQSAERPLPTTNTGCTRTSHSEKLGVAFPRRESARDRATPRRRPATARRGRARARSPSFLRPRAPTRHARNDGQARTADTQHDGRQARPAPRADGGGKNTGLARAAEATGPPRARTNHRARTNTARP